MTKLLAAFAIGLAFSGSGLCLAQDAPSTPAAQLDPRNLALANEIIDISYPLETRQAMLSNTTDSMMAQMRAAALQTMGDQLSDGARQIIDRHLDRVRERSASIFAQSTPPLFAAFARAYARRFTYDELVQIRAFVATPAGAKFVQQTSDMLADPDVARANTVYMTEAFTAIRPLQDQVQQELRAYFESRSESPPEPGAR